MKKFLLLAAIMSSTSLCGGQTQTPARKNPADFGSELKLSDLPSSTQKPLSTERALSCTNLAALMDPKLGNGDLSLVSDEVLGQLYRADALCWADTIDIKSPAVEINAVHVDLEVEVIRELDRRRYNQLVARYNELVANYRNLMQVSQMQSQLLHSAAPTTPPPQVIQVVSPPPQKPVDLFPRSPLQQRSQQINCTTTSTGLALNTTCTGQ